MLLLQSKSKVNVTVLQVHGIAYWCVVVEIVIWMMSATIDALLVVITPDRIDPFMLLILGVVREHHNRIVI